MRNVYTLLRMEFINRYGRVSIKDPKSILKLVFSAVMLVAVFIFVLWGAELFFGMFAKSGLEYEALVIFFTVIFIALLAVNISSTIKVLYYKGDNEILMRFPVSGTEIFLAKTIFLLLSQIISTFLILVPFLVAYSRVCDVRASFYVAIPIVLVFMVFIPFFLANVLAIPFMQMSNKIRNKFAFIIVMLAVLVTALFFIYTLTFEKLVLYLRTDKAFSVLDTRTVDIIRNAIKYFPTKYFAGMMLGTFETTQIINRETVTIMSGADRTLSYTIFVIVLEVCAIGTFLVIKYLYQKTLLANVEIEGSAFKKRTSNRRRSIFATLLHKEFIQVFRSINYSFQYFVLACAMPVMVFFCNRIAIAIGMDDIGYRIIPGLTLLVMLIFNTVIISFSATSITREGNNFYHTKVMPVSVRQQLLVKFTMYNMVSFVANTLTVAIIIFSKQMMEDPTQPIEWKSPLLIFAIVTMLSIGLTLISMRYDVKKPRFNLNGEGELVSNNANTTTSVLLGLFLSVVFGILGMVIPYFIKNIGTDIMFYLLLALSALFFVYAVLRYTIRLTRTYNRIV